MKIDDKTKLKLKIHAIEASTYLIKYCSIYKFGEGCKGCVFNTENGCAIGGSPFEYKPLEE